ncbi:transglutaminase-like domain-containing protein [Micromonospora sp. NBC_01813]|uniref:transglutaminase-like domain-containing protein n=1 Tax=Micromonospora sp. NBC_01813 TaxID=2975988 RepID=UPI002DDAD184|nr:transglutaminase family protein [Micromonospora sp. NBC_01813]WSA11077.1 transglutaminase family protein [Micromonospora sp. NBC_01813]
MSEATAATTGTIGCELSFEVTAAATVALAVTAHRQSATGRLVADTAGGPVVPDEVRGSWEAGGRLHLLHVPPGRVTIGYHAPLAPQQAATAAVVTPLDRIVALRPSRYCPSDRLGGFAAARFGGHGDPADAVRAICDYVHRNTTYTVGASGPGTDAAETLMSGAGVCRDYAHLTVTLCRALDIPARVVAVYAPGLSPMDFHLVAETALADRWYAWDATRLAPRQSMVRIATGRDAADVAFATTIEGFLEMTGMSVWAVAPGDLPLDDHQGLVALH